MKIRITEKQTTMIAVAVALLIFAGIASYRNLAIKNQLQQEKLRYETLVSGKLNLEKTLIKIRKDVESLTRKNAELDKLAKETGEKLCKKETEMKRLISENTSLADLLKNNQELEVLCVKLEEDISGLNLNLEELLDESSRSREELGSVKIRNEALTEYNAILEALLADNYRVEARKGKNDKLTVSARRTDKLSVSFDLPSEIGNALTFKILTPSGEEISSDYHKSATLSFQDFDKNYIANLTGTTSGNMNTRRAELVYEPDNNLCKGVYRITLYNGIDYVGSAQVRLK